MQPLTKGLHQDIPIMRAWFRVEDASSAGRFSFPSPFSTKDVPSKRERRRKNSTVHPSYSSSSSSSSRRRRRRRNLFAELSRATEQWLCQRKTRLHHPTPFCCPSFSTANKTILPLPDHSTVNPLTCISNHVATSRKGQTLTQIQECSSLPSYSSLPPLVSSRLVSSRI